jgi:hypothetical protein
MATVALQVYTLSATCCFDMLAEEMLRGSRGAGGLRTQQQESTEIQNHQWDQWEQDKELFAGGAAAAAGNMQTTMSAAAEHTRHEPRDTLAPST